MNLANKLTLLRILLSVPLIIVLSIFAYTCNDYSQVNINSFDKYYLFSAGFIFIIAMVTDTFDGWWARKNNKITTFGKLFDPLADKMIVTTSLIFLCSFGYTYIPIVVMFVIRDLIVDGSRNIAAKNNIKVEASFSGKLKTIFQSIAIPILFFLSPIIDKNIYWHVTLLNIPLFIALITSIVSGIIYFNQIIPVIKK